jgi:hypothetical protein
MYQNGYHIMQALVAVTVIVLLIYVVYKIKTLDTILDLEKMQSIQMAGQSVALGAVAECMGCGNRVAARLAALAEDDCD